MQGGPAISFMKRMLRNRFQINSLGPILKLNHAKRQNMLLSLLLLLIRQKRKKSLNTNHLKKSHMDGEKKKIN